MSWYGGSQITPALSGVWPKHSAMVAELCSRFACVSITPRGVRVEPEVYWRTATSLGFVAGGGQLIHNGYKASVGVNIKYLKSGTAQGSLLFIEHRPTGDVVVKSNAIGTMAIVANEAKPTGKATVNGKLYK